MQHEAIWFRGSYRYPNTVILDRALANARAWLDEEELHELDAAWMGYFEKHGALLRIDTALPIDGDRFAATAVVQALAIDAIEGIVEARRGAHQLDAFPYGLELED